MFVKKQGTQPAAWLSNLPKKFLWWILRIPAERMSFTREEKRMSQKGYVLRSRDVAHLLDCSPDEVIEFAKNEKLKAIKEGRFWKFRAADVLAFKKSLKKGP